MNRCMAIIMSFLAPCAARGQDLASAQRVPFTWVLAAPIADFEILRARSGHGTEYVLVREDLTADGLKLECLRGRSCNLNKPWLLIRNRKTLEGLGVFLAYPGNWRIEVRPAEGGETELYASTVPKQLPVMDTVGGLPLPGVLVAEFKGNWDAGANQITRFIRKKLLRDLGSEWPLIQYNTWYDQYEGLEENRLLAMAEAAAALGCEAFVIDAGWYGREADWRTALGDWRVNPQKLPNGTKPVADRVRGLGMKFGMWVEIECARSSAPVSQEHPEWFLRSGGELVSNRGVLDFGNPDALAWAKAQIDDVVTTHGLDYLKMDFNTDIVVKGDRDAQGNEKLWAHYRGLAALWRHIRERHPALIVENCSSGSLRQDVFPAAYTDTHWISDNIEPNGSLVMSFGATYLFPPEFCSHWTGRPLPTEAVDLESCFTVTMMGMFGLTGPLIIWDDQTRYHAADRIALYKRIRPWLRKADVYHLTEPITAGKATFVQAVQYHDAQSDRSAVMVFRAGDPADKATLKLKGLRPDGRYHVSLPPGFGHGGEREGEALARGLEIRFPQTGSSAVVRIVPKTEAKPSPLPVVRDLKVEPAPMLDARDPVSLAVSWSTVPEAQRYVIHFGRSGETLMPVRESFIPWCILSGLEPGVEYAVQVRAETFDGGASSPSSLVTAITRVPVANGPDLWLQPWRSEVPEREREPRRWGVSWQPIVRHYLDSHQIEAIRNRNVFGHPLSIRGRMYPEGIGTRMPSRLAFDVSRLPPEQRRVFRATVGVDDRATPNRDTAPSGRFIVLADGEEVYRSEVLTLQSDPVDVAVKLPASLQKLTLIVEPVTQGLLNFADWIRPRLEEE